MLGAKLDESEAEDVKQGGELVHRMDVPRLEEPESKLHYEACSLLNACVCMALVQV